MNNNWKWRPVWQPRPSDIAWTARMLAGTGASRTFWFVPSNHSIYIIDRPAQNVYLFDGPEMAPNGNYFEMLSIVLHRLGSWAAKHMPSGFVLPVTLRDKLWEGGSSPPVEAYIALEMLDNVVNRSVESEVKALDFVHDMFGMGKTIERYNLPPDIAN